MVLRDLRVHKGLEASKENKVTRAFRVCRDRPVRPAQWACAVREVQQVRQVTLVLRAIVGLQDQLGKTEHKDHAVNRESKVSVA